MSQAATLQALDTQGVLPSQALEQMIESGQIIPDTPVTEDQIQPASMDLRLGTKAYRVQAGFLPSNSTVEGKVDALKMHEIDLTESGVLERGAVYIIPLIESVDLPETISCVASPKSSTGRLDIMTRLIVDHSDSFDKVPAGHKGRMYVEVTPLTFSIIARTGDKLTQLRLRHGECVISDSDLRELDKKEPFVYLENGDSEEALIDDGLWLSVDLEGKNNDGIIGYRARRNAPLIDLQKVNHYSIDEFWEPMYCNGNGSVILNPEDFYIMASRERLRVPADYSSEMMPYETTAGELRVHYAGFFDPGFGTGQSDTPGMTAVLEIRSHDVPFVLEHGQKICRMVYENLSETPKKIYSQNIGSNYAVQGLKLGKHFRMEK